MGVWILIPIFLPVIAGILLLLPLGREKVGDGGKEQLCLLHRLVGAVLVLSAVLALFAAWIGENSFTLFELLKGIPIYFHVDGISKLFITIICIVWVLVGFYSFVYMAHEGRERQFYGFYLIVFGVLVALCFSGNLVTMYLFYEIMTLTSMPLVLHSRSRESIMAALKYLFYSMCGAYLGLFGIFYLYKYCDTLTFTAGGTLNLALAEGHTGILLIAIMAMLIGFGAKAGMFPLHSWLPTAHPVAPAPASAVLSGIIAKAGVLAIIRVVFYTVGADFIRGTWVQNAWMTLTLLTIFMGSMLAFREPVFKKRLAYSTVSQVSYVLFGLSLLNTTAMEGALMHVVFHALIKSALFLSAGAVIFKTGKSNVDELEGIGKTMPRMLWCFTFASLALVGIPPTSGFISKWYLAQGALEADVGVFSWIGPAVLLLSALLTAGYLLSIVTNGFFPKKKVLAAESAEAEAAPAERVSTKETDAPLGMLIPLGILAGLAVLLGIFPNPLINFVSQIAQSVL